MLNSHQFGQSGDFSFDFIESISNDFEFKNTLPENEINQSQAIGYSNVDSRFGSVDISKQKNNQESLMTPPPMSSHRKMFNPINNQRFADGNQSTLKSSDDHSNPKLSTSIDEIPRLMQLSSSMNSSLNKTQEFDNHSAMVNDSHQNSNEKNQNENDQESISGYNDEIETTKLQKHKTRVNNHVNCEKSQQSQSNNSIIESENQSDNSNSFAHIHSEQQMMHLQPQNQMMLRQMQLQQQFQWQQRFVQHNAASPSMIVTLKHHKYYDRNGNKVSYNGENEDFRAPIILPTKYGSMVLTIDHYEFPCIYPNCDKIFELTNDLYDHIRDKHSDMDMKCPKLDCEKSFQCMASLVYHARRHTTSKPYVCPLPKCAFETAAKGNMKAHLLSKQHHEIMTLPVLNTILSIDTIQARPETYLHPPRHRRVVKLGTPLSSSKVRFAAKKAQDSHVLVHPLNGQYAQPQAKRRRILYQPSHATSEQYAMTMNSSQQNGQFQLNHMPMHEHQRLRILQINKLNQQRQQLEHQIQSLQMQQQQMNNSFLSISSLPNVSNMGVINGYYANAANNGVAGVYNGLNFMQNQLISTTQLQNAQFNIFQQQQQQQLQQQQRQWEILQLQQQLTNIRRQQEQFNQQQLSLPPQQFDEIEVSLINDPRMADPKFVSDTLAAITGQSAIDNQGDKNPTTTRKKHKKAPKKCGKTDKSIFIQSGAFGTLSDHDKLRNKCNNTEKQLQEDQENEHDNDNITPSASANQHETHTNSNASSKQCDQSNSINRATAVIKVENEDGSMKVESNDVQQDIVMNTDKNDTLQLELSIFKANKTNQEEIAIPPKVELKFENKTLDECPLSERSNARLDPSDESKNTNNNAITPEIRQLFEDVGIELV